MTQTTAQTTNPNSNRLPGSRSWGAPLAPVTRREEEVLQAITDGCSTPEVAARLYLSQKTVKNHLASIYQKLDARDRTQAVLTALRLGIVHLD
jgi:two-component system response regulator DegU